MTASGSRAEQVRARIGQPEAEFKRLLAPQERLLAQTHFSRAAGKSRLEISPDAMGKRLPAFLIPVAVVLAVLFPDSPSLKGMLGGTAAEGRLGSWASRLVEASLALIGDNRFGCLLVTNRRLLLASYKIFGKDRDHAIDLEIPRDALADAAVEGRPFTRGRVVMRFTDGSMIALDLGTWRTSAARAFVQALTAPGTVAPPSV